MQDGGTIVASSVCGHNIEHLVLESSSLIADRRASSSISITIKMASPRTRRVLQDLRLKEDNKVLSES